MKFNNCKKMVVNMKNILAEKHLPVDKITLSFEDTSLNNEFTQGLAQRSIKVVRFSMLFAMIIYVVFGFILDDMMPDTNVFYIGNRIIGISLSIIILTLTYLPVFKNHSQAILSSLIVIGGLNIVTMAVDSGGELYVGLILTSIYAHSLLRLRFVYATVTTWFLVAMYLILLYTMKAAPLEVIVNNAFFLISSNVVGMVASYSIEYFMRSAFWKSHIVKIKSRELEEEYERKSLELESARQIQLAMLPQEQPIPKIDLSVIMKTASEIGGDYYDYHLSDDDTLTFAIGDVTGHGAKAGAMVTAMKILFSNYAPDLEITEFLKKANKSIRQLKLPKLYMAFAIGRIQNNQLEIAGVGLPSLIIHNSLVGSFEKVELKGLPLGSVDQYNFEKKIISLNSGDTLALMTDGLTELFNKNKNMFGYENIEQIFSDSVNKSTAKILSDILEAADKWSDGLPNEDDITFLIMRMKEMEDIIKHDHLAQTSDTFNSSRNKELTVQKINYGGRINYACYSGNN
jgi:hypothetical protein